MGHGSLPYRKTDGEEPPGLRYMRTPEFISPIAAAIVITILGQLVSWGSLQANMSAHKETLDRHEAALSEHGKGLEQVKEDMSAVKVEVKFIGRGMRRLLDKNNIAISEESEDGQ